MTGRERKDFWGNILMGANCMATLGKNMRKRPIFGERLWTGKDLIASYVTIYDWDQLFFLSSCTLASKTKKELLVKES